MNLRTKYLRVKLIILNIIMLICRLHSISPYEEACVLSVDGFRFLSTAWGYGNNTDEIDNKIYFPPLWEFLSALTQFLGFKNYVMSIKLWFSSYGKPKYVEKLRDVIFKNNGKFELNLDYFKFHKEDFNYRWENGKVEIEDLYTNNFRSIGSRT